MSSLAAALGALNLGPYAASAVMDACASRGRPGSAAWTAQGETTARCLVQSSDGVIDISGCEKPLTPGEP
jgi:hypothetical protein